MELVKIIAPNMLRPIIEYLAIISPPRIGAAPSANSIMPLKTPISLPLFLVLVL